MIIPQLYVFTHVLINDKSRDIMFSEKDVQSSHINVNDGFKFSFHKFRKSKIYFINIDIYEFERWQCVKRTRNSFYKIENEIIIEKNISHNHEPNEAIILTRQTISNSLKRKSKENTYL